MPRLEACLKCPVQDIHGHTRFSGCATAAASRSLLCCTISVAALACHSPDMQCLIQARCPNSMPIWLSTACALPRVCMIGHVDACQGCMPAPRPPGPETSSLGTEHRMTRALEAEQARVPAEGCPAPCQPVPQTSGLVCHRCWSCPACWPTPSSQSWSRRASRWSHKLLWKPGWNSTAPCRYARPAAGCMLVGGATESCCKAAVLQQGGGPHLLR